MIKIRHLPDRIANAKEVVAKLVEERKSLIEEERKSLGDVMKNLWR
ncbi:MAG: hypothetical protein ACE5HR_00245 [bacterium]